MAFRHVLFWNLFLITIWVALLSVWKERFRDASCGFLFSLFIYAFEFDLLKFKLKRKRFLTLDVKVVGIEVLVVDVCNSD